MPPPTADAGPDQTVSAGPSCTAQVKLSGKAAPDNKRLAFWWVPDTGKEEDVQEGREPVFTWAPGSHTIDLFLDGPYCERAPKGSDSVVVKIVDDTPPSITATASPSVLWPVNHKMVPVELHVSALDNCSAAPSCRMASVTSSEPSASGDPDWLVGENFTLQLRAERLGTGSGRVYSVNIECEDAAGNKSTSAVPITVPKGASSDQ